MRDRITRIARTNFLVLGLGALVMSAVGASASHLRASEADCIDYVCKNETDCKAASCDICHKDERCAKLPKVE